MKISCYGIWNGEVVMMCDAEKSLALDFSMIRFIEIPKY